MADLTSLGEFIPSQASIASFGLKTFSVITWIIIMFVVMILLGIVLYLFIMSRRFNKKILIFEKIGGRWEQTGKDKAIEIKYGLGGDTVFYLRKRKKYLPRPEMQTGRGTYWFAIREDGEYINITMEDVDWKMKTLGAKFLHPEMRYARTALLRNLKDRYDKPHFMEKYGMIIVNFVAVAIILVFMWLIIDKIISVGDSVKAMADTGERVMEKSQQIMSSLDKICSGSGMRPAG